MSLEFRPFDSARELAPQRELFRDCFPEAIGTAPETERHYRWKFHSFPHSPRAYEYGAYQDGKLVGYYAAIPYPYRLGGKEYRAAMVCDVMTHSMMRGKGIFAKLGAYSLDQMSAAGLDIAFGYPIRPEVIPGHLKVGWKLAGKLPLYLQVLKVTSALKKSSLRVAAPLGNLVCGFYTGLLSVRKGNFAAEKMSVDEFLSRPESPEILAESGTGLMRGAEFVRWRYGAPEATYIVVAIVRGGRICAAAFTRPTVLKEIPSLAILDVVATPEGRNGYPQLLGEIRRVALGLKLEFVASMVTPGRAAELKLLLAGYVRSPLEFQLIARPLSEAGRTLAGITAEDFNPMWVDSDDL